MNTAAQRALRAINGSPRPEWGLIARDAMAGFGMVCTLLALGHGLAAFWTAGC